jgi:hypothetical protein
MMMTEIDRPRTSRWRPGRVFEETWTNAKCALIGWLLRGGYSSVAVSEILDDGTDPAAIREMARKWGLRVPKMKSDEVYLVVPLTVRSRANLHARAQAHGLGDEELARRLLISATMPQDLYEAIVPEDQFE